MKNINPPKIFSVLVIAAYLLSACPGIPESDRDPGQDSDGDDSEKDSGSGRTGDSGDG